MKLLIICRYSINNYSHMNITLSSYIILWYLPVVSVPHPAERAVWWSHHSCSPDSSSWAAHSHRPPVPAHCGHSNHHSAPTESKFSTNQNLIYSCRRNKNMPLYATFDGVNNIPSPVFSPRWWGGGCCTCWPARGRPHDELSPSHHEYALSRLCTYTQTHNHKLHDVTIYLITVFKVCHYYYYYNVLLHTEMEESYKWF